MAVPLLCLIASLAACSAKKPEATKLPAPATVENAKKESELATIKLTPQAEKRLRIETVSVATRAVAEPLELSGEIVMPPGQTFAVTAPLAGTLQLPESNLAQGLAATDATALPANPITPAIGVYVRKGQPLFHLTPFLAPERDLRAQLERDAATSTERVAAARQRVQRTSALAEEKAGSQRAVEDAQAELALAEAELKTARQRLQRPGNATLASDFDVTVTAPISGVIQKLNANAGQPVTSGAPLLEIVSLATLWVRVPVYVGDLPRVARQQAARIHNLNQPDGAVRLARPVNAPPSADATAATADLYFALANHNNALRPGERVGVTLATRTSSEGIVIPWASVLHDIQGATWVYEQTAPQTYVRRAVEVRYVTDGLAVLARAPANGAKIVTTGAFELFGTEFGVGK
ncbi:MAG: efflux RND transporter periplasmic adaptor subunit [Acidobacteria bacterium]|nr:efflux RND transporter periplasmic adaptor subunit [Acidobacteriota bacterium]